MNRVKTVMLLATLTALLLWVGQALSGPGGLFMALVFAGVMNFGGSWWSDNIVLRMYGAQEVTEPRTSELYRIVRQLAVRGEMPMPKVSIIPEAAPNAFASGRHPSYAAVAGDECQGPHRGVPATGSSAWPPHRQVCWGLI